MAEEAHAEIDPRMTASIPWIMRNGVGIQIMETLAVGAFLTAFAVQLGASNFTIGLLAAVPHLSQLAQIPALAVVERYRNRSRIYFVSGLIARPAMLIIGAAAFIPDHDVALGVIVFAFALRYAMGAFLGCAWGSWMRDLIPDDRLMGEIFGARQKRMTFIGAVLSLVAAGFVDVWSKWVPLPQTYSYAVIYTLAFFGGLYGVWCAQHVYEPPMTAAVADRRWYLALGVPFKSKNFRRLLDVPRKLELRGQPRGAVLHRAHAEADGIESRVGRRSRHAQSDGGLPDGFAVGRDRRSVQQQVGAVGVRAAVHPVHLRVDVHDVSADRHVLTIPLLIAIHIATGVASAGVTLASGNITLKLAPRGDATAYLAASSLVNSLAAGTASMVGGLTADFFLSRKLSVLMRWHNPSGDVEFTALNFVQWDFFFLFASVIGLVRAAPTIAGARGRARKGRGGARRAVSNRASRDAQPVYRGRFARGHRVQPRRSCETASDRNRGRRREEARDRTHRLTDVRLRRVPATGTRDSRSAARWSA